MNKNSKLIITIIVALILINLGRICFDINSNVPYKYNEPIYWPLAIGFSSIGGFIIVNLILKNILPEEIWAEIKLIKSI